MEIKVLGTGCPKCTSLEKATRIAADSFNFEINVEKISEMNKIMDYGIMITPALVINDKVVSSGKALSVEQIKKYIEDNK